MASKNISKRNFLQSVGMVGGTAAVMTALRGWEMSAAATMQKPPTLIVDGNGKSLLILGGGLAGMVSAIEMRKKGYDVKILEAQSTPGGRCISARKGTVIQDVGGETQTCQFENNQYLNVGPWRIPAEHHAVLHYCKTLNVPLEVFVNKAIYSYYFSEKTEGTLKNKSIKQVEADTDRAGHIHELLAKCAADGSLDDKLEQEDIDKLVDYLKEAGLLDSKDLKYKANQARGYSRYPKIGMDDGDLSEPFALKELLDYKFGGEYEDADHTGVMFQPVGGMDQIARGMERALPKTIFRFNAEITDIMQSDDGVTVTFTDTKTGKVETATADYCISCLPFPLLNKINTDFSDVVVDALKAPAAAPVVKLGQQFSHRFWEDEMIYGGVTHTDIPGHEDISYPSSDLHSNMGGVILTSYAKRGNSITLGNKSIADRNEQGLDAMEKIHPGLARKYYNGQSISLAWHKQKYALAGWVRWSNRNRRRKFPSLLKGEKRVLFAGGGMAPQHTGWMVGAIESAWYAIEDLDKRVSKE